MPYVHKKDYEKIAKMYNELGSKATLEYIQQTYNIKAPRGVLMRLKKSPGFSYDAVNDKIVISSQKEENLFMGIDELCNQVTRETIPTVSTPICSRNYFNSDSLYKELMEEKLIEFTKYIKLSRHSNTISIDKTALLADGYKITVQ